MVSKRRLENWHAKKYIRSNYGKSPHTTLRGTNRHNPDQNHLCRSYQQTQRNAFKYACHQGRSRCHDHLYSAQAVAPPTHNLPPLSFFAAFERMDHSRYQLLWTFATCQYEFLVGDYGRAYLEDFQNVGFSATCYSHV